MSPRQRRQRGFALLIVLWTVALLALVGSALMAAARDRTRLAGDMRTETELETAADGAAWHAIFEVLDDQWDAGDDVRMARIGRIPVTVRLEDEAAKANPNIAPVGQLRALLESVSVDPRTAASLAASIIAWRVSPAGGSFSTLDDLGLVPGMTPEILQRLRPRLTVFTGTDEDPDTRNGNVRVMGITAVARGSGNNFFARHVIVRTNALRTGRRYEILMSERLPGVGI